MLRFRRMRSLQKFASLHGSIHNHFNQERHLTLSLRDVEDLLHERGVDITHETVRVWWGRFGQVFAAEIRRARVDAMRALSEENRLAIFRLSSLIVLRPGCPALSRSVSNCPSRSPCHVPFRAEGAAKPERKNFL